MANTGQRQPDKKVEKKDEGKPDKAKAGTSGPGSDNTQAGSHLLMNVSDITGGKMGAFSIAFNAGAARIGDWARY